VTFSFLLHGHHVELTPSRFSADAKALLRLETINARVIVSSERICALREKVRRARYISNSFHLDLVVTATARLF